MDMASAMLVTGATGFIGHRLLRPGDRALVREAGALPDEVVGDLLDPPTLSTVCEGIDTVFHCAGYAHAFASSDPDAHWRINCEGTRNLLEAAGEAGVKRFVFLSSVKAMAEPGDACIDEDWPGEPVTPYGRAKRAAEDAVLEAGAKYGMHVVNLRLAMVYGRGGRGNLERMARGIRAGWFPPLPETGNRRSLVHVDDVVAAMRLVAERPEANGRTYIVADPAAYSGREIYDAIRVALRKPTLRWSVPAGVFRAAGRLNGRAGEIVDRLLGSACYSPARIGRELGWRARVSLAEGVREMLA
ncbi:MAG: NAD-dependent epimerase/dehydratase family protein [Candidatus Nitricoxidivorans perseverans]|uniref:NAD-dependent epimerase/dehydratase family protein n=1 Tax=Candidatus Nitricoxidivorans perseverans TaxID=2975601 RepID=A0AA49FKA4_9PROT|nr:MAG: NAD-dependent epimerase/dehydratase family protein [Candidatus Nitricoxidivorans perseverans]